MIGGRKMDEKCRVRGEEKSNEYTTQNIFLASRT
jgi:hypothetical protein